MFKSGLLGKLFPSNEKISQKASEAIKEKSLKVERHQVTGIQYHFDEFMQLAKKNPQYDQDKKSLRKVLELDERIYEYSFSSSRVELVTEDDNPHDPKAIKVIVDGRHIGYIKKGSCSHIRNLLNSGEIKDISVQLGGGNYKVFSMLPDKDGNLECTFCKDSTKHYATIAIAL